MDWKLTLWGEVSDSFEPSTAKDDEKVDIGVDNFETEKDQSFLDREKPDEKTPLLIYSLVGVFMVASIASTAFIVKRYMLSSDYTRAAEEEGDSYEFDNLLQEDNVFELDDDSDSD